MDASNAQHITTMNTVTGKHKTIHANDSKGMRWKQVWHWNAKLLWTQPV